MGSSVPTELTLAITTSSNEPWIPRSTADLLAEPSRMDNASEKISKLENYVNRMQEEMKKIDEFKRELPLCMLLLNSVIGTMKDEIMQCKNSNSEPILEEFIPLKKSSPDEKDEERDDVKDSDIVDGIEKMNWMSSMQLWNSDSNNQKNSRDYSQSIKAHRQTDRKPRLCWTPELHCEFVSAMQQLGGAEAATPRQIRELMQDSGVTNDEVKSHLQKYRRRMRSLPPTTTEDSTVEPDAPGGRLGTSQEQCGESSKPSNSHSSSPQGPLHLAGSSRGTSITVGDSLEDEDDERSESHS